MAEQIDSHPLEQSQQAEVTEQNEGSQHGTESILLEKKKTRARGKKSWVWQHFTQEQNHKDVANCKYCNQTLSTNTTSMFYHLKKVTKMQLTQISLGSVQIHLSQR